MKNTYCIFWDKAHDMLEIDFSGRREIVRSM
jgi:hypothetical protein